MPVDEKKEIILKLENICQSYVVGNDVKDAVDNVSLEVYDNEFLVVLGPGHCGKTVLMNTIAGIESPSAARSSWKAKKSMAATAVSAWSSSLWT